MMLTRCLDGLFLSVKTTEQEVFSGLNIIKYNIIKDIIPTNLHEERRVCDQNI